MASRATRVVPRRHERAWPSRYGIAVLLIGSASLVTSGVLAWFPRVPFGVFYGAVAVAASFGGLGPALLAVAVATGVKSSFLVPSRQPSASASAEDLFELGVSVLIAVMISYLTAERRRAKREASEGRHTLQVTLARIGDGVITTDVTGRITFMNAVACRLVGWTAAEATGHRLTDVFRILDEDTRAHVEDPVVSVLREGSFAGSANHTVLLERDGTERPIDVDGSPIRSDQGEILGVVLALHDIGERRAVERDRERLHAAVESERGRLQASLEQMPVGVVLAEAPAGRVTYLNARVEELLGRSLRTEDLPLARALRGEVVRHEELAIERGDGTHGIFAASAGPIRDAGGRIVAAVLVFDDITARKNAERETLLRRERATRAEAEAAARAKDEFLATVSHELRQPLNAIAGWARLLRTGLLDPARVNKAMEVIERNARLQAQVVDDLLDMSRIVTGKLRLDVRAIEVAPIIDTVLETVAPAANAKRIEVRKALDPSVCLEADPDRLQQAVWNLVANAIKFTPRGGVVEVWVRRVESRVEVGVADTGAGIASEFLPFVFDRFRQAESGVTRTHGGLGLGLAIVRHLVELHGGTVAARSEGLGRGSTFVVTLPVAALAGEPPPVAVVALSGAGADADPGRQFPDLRGLHVLVVEDDADSREMLRNVLEQCGARTTTAATVGEAVETFRLTRPDVMVSDIGMAGEGGYDLIQRIRALPLEEGGDTPAIALTGYAGASNVARALRAGFDRHVAKPVSPIELCQAIRKVAERPSAS